MLITTFNILADEFISPDTQFMDKWYPTIDFEDLKMKNRFHTVIKYITGDIILLQEVSQHIRRRLIAVFDDDYIVLPLSKHKTTGAGNLTIVRRNKFTTVKHKTFYVGDVAIGLTAIDDIDVYNIHLDDASMSARRRQLNKIIATFDTNKKIIVGGDCNTDDPVLHAMLSSINFEMNVVEKNGTYLCEKPMIDWIYVYGFSSSVVSVNNTISGSNCYQKTIKKYGSDHHPVIARVS